MFNIYINYLQKQIIRHESLISYWNSDAKINSRCLLFNPDMPDTLYIGSYSCCL